MARLLALLLLLCVAWPIQARFVSADPVPPNANSGENFNRYAYANDNPYRYADPDGRWAEDLFLGVPSVAIGGKSLFDNVRAGRAGPAIADGLGLAYDFSAILLPGVPGGAGLGIQAGRAAAARLPDSALVCRGGTCSADRFANGTGVTLDADGKLQNVSVNSAPGATMEQLTSTIRNGQVGTTTVGEVRKAGGDVTPSPNDTNPTHCTLCGITPQQAQDLFKTDRNPNRGGSS